MSLPIFRRGVEMAGHTTFRIGGPAVAFYTASTRDEVARATWKAEGMGLPWYVIGHGSNILVSDSGFGGAVIAFKDTSPPRIEPDGSVTTSGGTPLRALVDFYADNGLSGVEDLAGIPGTVGGAIAGNAGAYGTSMGGLVRSALLLDRNGGMSRVGAGEIAFSYRQSSVKERGEVVLEATLLAARRDPATIRARIEERLADRRGKHPDPTVVATAGSYFRNPVGTDGRRVAAGSLLEDAGCKGLSVGGAGLWQQHANIIVTDGRARSADVLALAENMVEMVNERCDVKLVPEVVYLE